MKLAKLLIGLVLGLLIMVIPMTQLQATSPLDGFKTLAVQLEGRKKPLDTVARETVIQIHGSDHYRLSDGTTLSPMETYLDLWFNRRDWNEEPIILVSYRPLKAAMGVDEDQKYFTFRALMQSDLGTIAKATHRKQNADQDLNRLDQEALKVEDRLALMLATVARQDLPIIPHPTDIKGAWTGIPSATSFYPPEQVADLAAQFEMLQRSYLLGPSHWEWIGSLVDEFHQSVAALSPDIYPAAATLQQEVTFSEWHPFGWAWILYAVAFLSLLAIIGLQTSEWYWGSLGIFVAGILVHGYGFWTRMQIADRPPVTNMYESVIWVSFGVAGVALLFELIQNARYYLLAAAPISIVLLILADQLPAVLDASIQPLVPVLRDNFWLSVHVPTITLSYACFALAMGLGHILLGHYLFKPDAQERIRILNRLNYGVLQLGVLLLTTGIVLGGIWAHFSWGRFWGWDPKETWAAIALLCYVFPLHGRLVGWVSPFGLAVVSVVSFNAVLMAWYGVNFVLGKGLHSYGFGVGGNEWVAAGVALDLLLVGASTVSFLKRTEVTPTETVVS